MPDDNIRIGLGTAAIGRPQYINLRQETVPAFDLPEFIEKGKRVLEAAYQRGIRYFDTAPGYGIAEQMVLDWIREKRYKDVEIATKWGYTYTANFDPKAPVHEIKEHSLSKLKEQWGTSQKLLPQLSTYQIHSATFESGVLDNPEVLYYLSHLKEQFGLRIGLTTSGANQGDVIKRSLEVKFEGESLFSVFQVTYNILDQSLLDLGNLLASPDKRIVIKEALANGRLFPNPEYPHYARAYELLARLATKYEVGIDAIALRFCLDSLHPFMLLSGASDVTHVFENLKASQFKLENGEIEALKDLAVPPDHYWSERKKLAWK